ncbi:hypothetical protein AB4K20DRAFT_1953867 [Rhizopus microsporus]
MVHVEYVAQHVAKYILAKISKHVDIDADYQRRITEKAVTSACDLYRVCKGVTLKGSRCSRHVAGDADYCFQHRGARMASNNPRHKSSAEKESSGSDEESPEDEGSASEGESSGSEEESSEEETEEDSDEESSGSSEEEPSGSDEESTEDDASASEEESEGESSGESSDEEVPPPKNSKKAKKTKKYRTPVEDCPEGAEEEPSPAHLPERREAIPLVQEFEDEKDRFACAFLGAVVETVDNLKGGGACLYGDDITHLLRLKYNARCVIKDIQEAGVINHQAVDKITASLGGGSGLRVCFASPTMAHRGYDFLF